MHTTYYDMISWVFLETSDRKFSETIGLNCLIFFANSPLSNKTTDRNLGQEHEPQTHCPNKIALIRFHGNVMLVPACCTCE